MDNFVIPHFSLHLFVDNRFENNCSSNLLLIISTLLELSLMEEDHLLTKASIPYRDRDLNSSKDDIINRRLNEQLLSNLLSTNKWREKWGMTKLSVKS